MQMANGRYLFCNHSRLISCKMDYIKFYLWPFLVTKLIAHEKGLNCACAVLSDERLTTKPETTVICFMILRALDILRIVD